MLRQALLSSVVALTGMAVLATAPAEAARRVALVIDNAEAHGQPVAGARQDAAGALAQSLQKLGFEVVVGSGLNGKEVEERLAAFTDRLNGAEVALLYYAGLGGQDGGGTFLVPTEGRSRTYSASAKLRLEPIIDLMQQRSARSLLVLDGVKRQRVQPVRPGENFEGASGGFGKLPGVADKVMILSDAASIDSEAAGSLTAALVRRLAQPRVNLARMATLVRQDVFFDSGSLQVPMVSGSLPVSLEVEAEPEVASGASCTVSAEHDSAVLSGRTEASGLFRRWRIFTCPGPSSRGRSPSASGGDDAVKPRKAPGKAVASDDEDERPKKKVSPPAPSKPAYTPSSKPSSSPSRGPGNFSPPVL